MKFEFAALALVLTSLLSTSAYASSVPLSGTYKLLSNDCIVGGTQPNAIDATKIKIEANDEQVSLLQTVSVPFAQVGEGDAVLANDSVGDFSGVMLGGSTYRTTGVYSDGGNVFEYAEYDNQAPGSPLDELRATKYELDGKNLKITQTGDLVAPRICRALKLN